MSTLGCLRNIRDDELELMRTWRNAPSVRANMYTRHEISPEEHLTWWAKTSLRSDQRYFMYENEGQPLGIVGFMLIDNINGNCSWAFYAAPSAPRGTGSAMEFLALEYAFRTLNLHKLHCEVLAFNMPVVKLHQKFGFQVEGIFREHHKVGDEFFDIYRLGLFSNEWSLKRDEMFNKLTGLVNR